MGNWQLEVARMMLYLSFPVGVFHYFNQPENFEEWVVKTRKEDFPPESKKQREEFAKLIEDHNRKHELLRLQEMEEQHQKQRTPS